MKKKETSTAVDKPKKEKFKLNVKLEKDADGVEGRIRLTVELLENGKVIAKDSDFIKV